MEVSLEMELSGIVLVEYKGRSALFPLKENSNPGLLPSDSLLFEPRCL